MKAIAFRSIETIIVLVIVLAASGVLFPTHAHANTICYPDGCAILNFDTSKSQWDQLFGNQTTVAQVFEKAVAFANANGDPIWSLQRNAAGNITFVGCGNSHTHQIIYNCSYSYSCQGNTLVDYCGNTTACPYGCSNGACNATGGIAPASATSSCQFNGQVILNGRSVTAYQSYYAPSGSICEAEARTCNNGKLSGTYLYGYCTVYGGLIQPNGTQTQNVPAPTLSQDLKVIPTLVKSGETTQVFWTAQDAQSCIASSTNGDSWSVTSSGVNGLTSNRITQQTTFYLTCIGYSGSNPPSISQTAQVNIVPNFNER